ncbi:MAG TPA: valine--tRNA ligase [Actinomycetota bacterium]|jgi:valyl-tRNA synthetase|nr:valine--tRNA ligase [Actinomycetota bacterium]
MANVPDKPSLDGLEARWGDRWEADGIYRYDPLQPRERTFVVDTPPPTVSGAIHVGHVMSYTHTDVVVRYRRMTGKTAFYPIGWDDNGLATERRVQNYYGVRCDPSLPVDPAFDPDAVDSSGGAVRISRPNFVELCERLTAEDEKAFEALFRTLGLSVDWTTLYTTIDERSRRVSQKGFLHLVRRGLAYKADAPTMWDVDFQTAVAQAEIEDREIDGAYHRVRFDGADADGALEIETSRPELIPSCVALVVNPSDERYRALVGSNMVTPLFGVEVPVVAHRLADPEKGTGAAMICTFGDVTDVQWWRELQLPTRVVMQRDGTIAPPRWGESGWPSGDAARANEMQREIAGMPAKKARRRIAELLGASGYLLGEPQQVRHVVKFYERGERPLEIVSTRQWYVKQLEFRPALLERGRQLQWHPPHLRARFESWVEGLNSDWAVSRQRFFGVPFPAWYRLDEEGVEDFEHPILADERSLPVDPSTDAPDGFGEDRRGKPGGFVGDPDVMDTWATSSLSPHIALGWGSDDGLFERLFPMDVRPQAHEIIRTWLYYTVLRAHLEQDSLPWYHATISGWVLDPDRKKMSKSKGNVLTPIGLLEQYGADAVRYWAASPRLGVDTAFKEEQIKIGRRLAIKILNASRFALSLEALDGPITQPLDRSMLARLAEIVAESTQAFESWEHARALDVTERFFWSFTDDYLELVKGRAYGGHGPEAASSAVTALRTALSVLLRLFAPFVPYVTEEVWSWWREGSIHRASWPSASELDTDADPTELEVAASILGEVRKTKALAKRSLKTEVRRAVVHDTAERLAVLDRVRTDLVEAGNVAALETRAADGFSVDVELGD